MSYVVVHFYLHLCGHICIVILPPDVPHGVLILPPVILMIKMIKMMIIIIVVILIILIIMIILLLIIIILIILIIIIIIIIIIRGQGPITVRNDKMVISCLHNVEKIWNSAQINLSSTLNFYRKYCFDATTSTEKSTIEIDADLAKNYM